MQKEECIDLIESFIAEKLNGDIWKLIDYDLDQLENDEKYGGYDPDNSKIANAIYTVLWGNVFNNLTFDELGKSYRGDTINSFHTLMGHPTEDLTSFIGIQKYTDNEEIVAMAKEFHRKYHTIGNMMILPNIPLEINGKKYTLNTARSRSPLNDYFDAFLVEVKNALTGTIYLDCDEEHTGYLIGEIIGKNEEFDEKYFYLGGMEKFEDFIHTFYLEKYVDMTFEIPLIFLPHACHWKGSYGKEEYEQIVTNYITKATEIIEYRGSCMIKDLERALQEHNSNKKADSQCEKKAEVKQREISEKFPYVLLTISTVLACFCAIGCFFYFLIIDGYNTMPAESALSLYSDRETILGICFYMLFVSIGFMGMVYKREHRGIRRFSITVFYCMLFIALILPYLFETVVDIIENSKWFVTTFPTGVKIIGDSESIFVMVIGTFMVMSSVGALFMFCKEEEYKKFVKYWGCAFGLQLLGIPILLAFLSYKLFIVLCEILIVGTLLMLLYHVVKRRCPNCKRFAGMKYIETKLLKEEQISIKVHTETKNSIGTVTGTSEQYIPGKRKVYEERYQCKHCGYVQTKKVTRDIKSI